MNVFVLVEETEQPEFVYDGEAAEPTSRIMGIYQDPERANKEMEKFNEMAKKDEEQYETDPVTYYVEERPLL